MMELNFPFWTAVVFVPFVIQGSTLLWDELYFHRLRGLDRWETAGHPLDTLTSGVCYLWLSLKPPSLENLKVYLALAAFSCLFVTKDEFVHQKVCIGLETWLHSVLFVVHPICFLGAAYLWYKNETVFQRFLLGQTALVFLFMVYQIIYWGWIHNGSRGQQPSLRYPR